MAKQSLEGPAGWEITVGDSFTGLLKCGVSLTGPMGHVAYEPAHTRWGARRIVKRFRNLAWAAENKEF